MRFYALIGLVALLFTAGCSSEPSPPMPSPPPNAQADAQALEKKIAELKAKNPQLPPTAIGTMAAKELQQEKMQGKQ